MDFSKNGRRLATGSSDGEVRIYDELTKQKSHAFKKGDW